MNKKLQGSVNEYLNQVQSLVVALNNRGEVQFVNISFCTSLGYQASEVTGKNWFEFFVPPEMKERSKMEFKSWINSRNESVKKREGYVLNKNGELVMIEWQDRIIRDRNGNFSGAIFSGQDITEPYELRRYMAIQQAQSRKQMMQAVIEAAELERKQIAFELHDGVNQVLAVCKLLVESEMAQRESATLSKVTGHLQKAIDEIRSISHQLNPADLGNEGLYLATKDLINQINDAGPIHVKLKMTGTKFLKLLPSAVALNLYRIIQEAMNNVLKHAKASEVKITLQGSARAVDLEIIDNGQGFQRKKINSGLGIRSVYTRAEASGGKACIVSTRGEGTILSIHIPT